MMRRAALRASSARSSKEEKDEQKEGNAETCSFNVGLHKARSLIPPLVRPVGVKKKPSLDSVELEHAHSLASNAFDEMLPQG